MECGGAGVAAGVVHGTHTGPHVHARVVALDRAEVLGAVEAATHVDHVVHHRHPRPTPARGERRHRHPLARPRLEPLHLNT